MRADVAPFPHPVTHAFGRDADKLFGPASRERSPDGHAADLVLVATALRDASPRILNNWALRVATMPLFRAFPELTLADLRRQIPDILEAALLAVTSSSFAIDLTPLDSAIARSEEHGRSRHGIASLDVLLAEFHALRREIRNQLWRVAEVHVREHDRRERVVRNLDDRLTTVLDAIEQAAVVAWVVEYSSGRPGGGGA